MRQFHSRWWQTEDFLYQRQHRKNEEWRIMQAFRELVIANLNDSINRSMEEFERQTRFGQPVQGAVEPMPWGHKRDYRLPHEMKPGGADDPPAQGKTTDPPLAILSSVITHNLLESEHKHDWKTYWQAQCGCKQQKCGDCGEARTIYCAVGPLASERERERETETPS